MNEFFRHPLEFIVMTPYIVVCCGKSSLFNRKCIYKSWMFKKPTNPCKIQVVMLCASLLSQVILMSARQRQKSEVAKFRRSPALRAVLFVEE